MRIFNRLPANPLCLGNQTKTFLEYFKNFDKIPTVQAIFGNKTTEVLNKLKVELSWINGYMYVDGNDGHLVISKKYLKSGNRTEIYLDLIHELCHVKQFMEGKELFDPRYAYVDRPTEIEAYRYCIKEARRLGFSQERIRCYLRTEWINDSDFERLVKTVNTSDP
jgi:hypothetical protein